MRRAREADLADLGSVDRLASSCDVLLSICPPHAAADVARSLPGFRGIYVDANAVAPQTARAISELVGRYVDGGIVGPPPRSPGTTRLYLSGGDAETVAGLFAGTPVEAVVVHGRPYGASAVKIAYAAWTKGSAALLLAIEALARAEGVDETLLAERRRSLPALEAETARAARAAAAKGWRWAGEMDEIAATFAAAGLPDGFHRAAAAVFRQGPPDSAETAAPRAAAS
jgi:3-hydroxyisobutyrate dehydrogenase-like beta-hydroxyacid dehydrogenase